MRYAESLGRVSPQVGILASQALVRYADEFAHATPPSYLSMHNLDEIVRALKKLRNTPEKKVDEFSRILAKMRGSPSADV